jgi:hypothetical protein
VKKQVQQAYWKLIKESAWNKYHIGSTAKGSDFIKETILVDNPDFNNLEILTE